jgi:hypothetical protein
VQQHDGLAVADPQGPIRVRRRDSRPIIEPRPEQATGWTDTPEYPSKVCFQRRAEAVAVLDG